MQEQETKEQETMEGLEKNKPTSLMEIGTPVGGLVPQNFEGLWRLSNIMAKSGMMPRGLEKPESVFVAVQMGLEVGLPPMQAVQNIAVINGRPSIWGDVGIALVQASGELEDINEEIASENGKLIARCTAKRKGRPTPVTREFSQDDAVRADLWGNKSKSPWIQYPKRMLQMRARWWVLRDLFADVLKGLSPAEEVQDMELGVNGTYRAKTATEAKTEALRERLAAAESVARDIKTGEESEPTRPSPPPDPAEPPRPEWWTWRRSFREMYDGMTPKGYGDMSLVEQYWWPIKCHNMGLAWPKSKTEEPVVPGPEPVEEAVVVPSPDPEPSDGGPSIEESEATIIGNINKSIVTPGMKRAALIQFKKFLISLMGRDIADVQNILTDLAAKSMPTQVLAEWWWEELDSTKRSEIDKKYAESDDLEI